MADAIFDFEALINEAFDAVVHTSKGTPNWLVFRYEEQPDFERPVSFVLPPPRGWRLAPDGEHYIPLYAGHRIEVSEQLKQHIAGRRYSNHALLS